MLGVEVSGLGGFGGGGVRGGGAEGPTPAPWNALP